MTSGVQRRSPQKTLRIAIRIYAVLTAGVGVFSLLFFFPSTRGCSDIAECLPYSLVGLLLSLLSLGIFIFNPFARRCLLAFSLLFIGFFTYESVWLWQNDFTGQGLIGMVLLSPILIACVVGVLLLFPERTKKEFIRKSPAK